MLAQTNKVDAATRRLIVRDTVAFLSLLLGTIVLFAMTLFLFRTFTSHREVLAQRWSARGRAALQSGHPADAIVAMRTALSYAPGTRDYELLLATALGEAGHTEESYGYFMGLWDSQPGSGEVNLQLARLAAKRSDRPATVNFYRAALFGTWEGDGVERRAAVRLELARYLLAREDLAAARLELLVAGGNAPDDYGRDMAIGGLLEQAQDPGDAWGFYQRASALRPGDVAGRRAAGRLAFRMGDYQSAERLLSGAERGESQAGNDSEDFAMMQQAARMMELAVLPTQPIREQVAHLVLSRSIAKTRFDICIAEAASSALLQPLSGRWAGPVGTANGTMLLHDTPLQISAMKLIFDTEAQAESVCGPASGDDALLLRLASHPPTRLPALEAVAQASIPHD